MLKKISLVFLCSLSGAVFIFSGYVKLYPIEPFEYTFVDLGFINWQISPFIARILIGLEFLIGLLLFLNAYLKIAFRAGVVLLSIFCIYLVLLIFFGGNKGNCGCFGSYINMTPGQALLKNMIMLGIFFVLHKYHSGWMLNKRWNILIALLFASALALPFVLNPVELNYSKAYLHEPSTDFKLELDSLYNHATLNIPPKELSRGKQIIVFMSLTCPHCRIAANKIRIIHERNPDIPFYLVLNGEEKNLKPFFDDTGTWKLQHCMLVGRNFVYLAGLQLPVIYLINNSKAELQVNYFELNQEEIEKWLKR